MGECYDEAAYNITKEDFVDVTKEANVDPELLPFNIFVRKSIIERDKQ